MRNKRLNLCALLLLGFELIGVQAQQRDAKTSDGTTVTDIDGNVYKTVTIGKQVWMKENLKVTRYQNGDTIGTTTPATLDINSESTPKYQWSYAGNDSNVAIYGRLYTWFAITDNRNVCPIGWHVSTDAEWAALLNSLGEPSTVGDKLIETGTVHWKGPNTDATNESGFTALPAGSRWSNGQFAQMGECTHFWTATEFEGDTNNAWRRLLFEMEKGWSSKKNGWPVRCIKD
jgi:uncharacterized protein (TIGR02145 family)